MTPLEYFRLLAPEFAGVADAPVQTWLTMAGNLVDTGCLDAERAAMACALYAAHLLSLTLSIGRASDGTLGAVTSEREGDLQRTYGALKGSDSWLGQTPYGQQYLDITKVCSGAAIMTRVTPWQ